MFATITAFAKTNKLSKYHPLEKFILAILPIIVVGFSNNIRLPLINIIVFTLLHYKYRHPFIIVYKYTLGIILFVAISSITFVWDYGILYCIIIILKSLSAGLALSFLALSTPLDDMLYSVSRISLLRDMCDIAKSMERFIMIVEDEFNILYKSMQSRGGFNTIRLRIKSIGKLGGALFINTLRRWKEIQEAIHSRGYKGKMPYLNRDYKFSIFRFMMISLYDLALICIYLFVL